MLSLISENLGTICIGLIVASIVAGIIVKIVRDKQKGKCIGCDADCGACPSQSNSKHV